MAVLAHIGRRVAGLLALLLVVSALIFAAVELLPGDVATQLLGPNATPERVEVVSQRLGLDEPAPKRYLRWLGGLLRGDLGDALTTNRSVADTIGVPLRNTAVLAGCAFAAMATVAVGLGVAAGRRAGSRLDATVSGLAVAAVSVPEFVVAGLLVAVFAFELGWFPAVSLVGSGSSPLDRPEILVLPVASLAIVGGTFGARLVRAAVADAARRPHVEAARLAGVSEVAVLRRHLLPGAAGPIAQVVALLVPYVVGGTVVVERVFSYPGLGSLLVEQVRLRDAPVVEAAAIVAAAIVVAALLVADVVGALADPKLRTPR